MAARGRHRQLFPNNASFVQLRAYLLIKHDFLKPENENFQLNHYFFHNQRGKPKIFQPNSRKSANPEKLRIWPVNGVGVLRFPGWLSKTTLAPKLQNNKFRSQRDLRNIIRCNKSILSAIVFAEVMKKGQKMDICAKWAKAGQWPDITFMKWSKQIVLDWRFQRGQSQVDPTSGCRVIRI